MKTKPPFDGEIHAVSAKNMPDLNRPKREPGWFLGEPTPDTSPMRDEAPGVLAQTERRENGLRANMDEVATLAHQMISIIRRGALRPDPKTGWLEPASAPAPASGGVDAVAYLYEHPKFGTRALVAANLVWPYDDMAGLEPHNGWKITPLGPLSPAATPVSEAEPVAIVENEGPAPVDVRFTEACSYGVDLPHGTKLYTRPMSEAEGDFIEVSHRIAALGLKAALAKPAGGVDQQALNAARKIYNESLNLDVGALGATERIIRAYFAALSQSTSVGRVGE